MAINQSINLANVISKSIVFIILSLIFIFVETAYCKGVYVDRKDCSFLTDGIEPDDNEIEKRCRIKLSEVVECEREQKEKIGAGISDGEFTYYYCEQGQVCELSGPTNIINNANYEHWWCKDENRDNPCENDGDNYIEDYENGNKYCCPFYMKYHYDKYCQRCKKGYVFNSESGNCILKDKIINCADGRKPCKKESYMNSQSSLTASHDLQYVCCEENYSCYKGDCERDVVEECPNKKSFCKRTVSKDNFPDDDKGECCDPAKKEYCKKIASFTGSFNFDEYSCVTQEIAECVGDNKHKVQSANGKLHCCPNDMKYFYNNSCQPCEQGYIAHVVDGVVKCIFENQLTSLCTEGMKLCSNENSSQLKIKTVLCCAPTERCILRSGLPSCVDSSSSKSNSAKYSSSSSDSDKHNGSSKNKNRVVGAHSPSSPKPSYRPSSSSNSSSSSTHSALGGSKWFWDDSNSSDASPLGGQRDFN